MPVGPADFGLDREVAFGSSSSVAPAVVAGGGLALLLMGPVIGAVEGEVPQGGELGFDPGQPRAVRRGEHQLNVVVVALDFPRLCGALHRRGTPERIVGSNQLSPSRRAGLRVGMSDRPHRVG